MSGGVPVRPWRDSATRRALLRIVAVLLALLAVGLPLAVGAAVWVDRNTPRTKLLPHDIGSIFATFRRGSIPVADGLLEDSWEVGRRPAVILPDPLTWEEDPYGERYWRFEFYGFRPEQDLLYAWLRTGDERYLAKLTSIVEGFLDRGVHSRWLTRDVDLHAVAWRAMTLVNIHRRLAPRGDLPGDLAARLAKRIADEGRWLADPDHFEPHFNHGVNEAAALLLVAAAYPELPDAPEWYRIAMERLTYVIGLVADDEGVEVGDSPYQQFQVLNAFVAIREWAQEFELPMPETLEAAIRRMAHFAGVVLMPDGSVPLKGGSLPLVVSELDEEARSALTGLDPALDAALGVGDGAYVPEQVAHFATSGLTVLRGSDHLPDAPDDTWVLFDTGPWRTSRSHLDRMGIVLYADGTRLLPDAGIAADSRRAQDEGVEPVEAYWASTAAHNTVVVDGANQTRTGEVGSGASLAGPGWAYQSGWHRLYPGVTHSRAVLLVRRGVMLVVDRLESASLHDYAQTWHLPVDSTLAVDGLSAAALGPDGAPQIRITQLLPDGLGTSSTLDGSLSSWVSSAHDESEPNAAISFHARTDRTTLVTLVTTGEIAATVASGEATILGNRLTVSLCADGRLSTVGITALAARVGEDVEVSHIGDCVASPLPPMVRITSPVANDAVTDHVEVTTEVSGTTRPARVDFLVDGKVVFTDATEPYAMPLAASGLPDAAIVRLAARAHFADRGPVTTGPVRVIVSHRPPGETAPTVVSLTFDDGLANEMEAVAILGRHGLHGTFYVISGRIGATRYMSWDDLDRLAATGHEVGGHTSQHLALPTLEYDEQVRQLCHDRRVLAEHGHPVRSVSYPFGRHDLTTRRAAAQCGYSSGRATSGIRSDRSTAESIPPADLFAIRAVASFDARTSVEDMVSHVRDAEADAGGWVVLTFHSICADACDVQAVTPDDLALLASWLSARARSGTVVRTVGDVIGGEAAPLIEPPAPRRPADPGLVNGSFEERDLLDARHARCWTLGQPSGESADGVVASTLDTLDPRTGAHAARISIAPERTDVVVRLQSRLDLGGCAPVAEPGAAYTAAVWHRGDAPAVVRVLYVDELGRASWSRSETELPPSVEWTSSGVTTPPMPSDARRLVLRIDVTGPGAITIDDASIAPASGTP